ncbi:MAG: hypothetical protein JXA78_09450, partial [Anaerolineales bacterium]|nr:hypothetical protein [Anaerolineales bacterium]
GGLQLYYRLPFLPIFGEGIALAKDIYKFYHLCNLMTAFEYGCRSEWHSDLHNMQMPGGKPIKSCKISKINSTRSTQIEKPANGRNNPLAARIG